MRTSNIRNESGVGLLPGVWAVALLSVMGMAAVGLVGSGEDPEADKLNPDRASYAASSGLEWAIRQVVSGVADPSVSEPGQPVGGLVLAAAAGQPNFIVSRRNGVITSTGRAGTGGTMAQVTMSTRSPLQADCLRFQAALGPQTIDCLPNEPPVK